MILCHITINVINLEESLRFYRDIIGLPVKRRFSTGPDCEIAFLGDGETEIELICNQSHPDISISQDISIGFEVSSVVGAIAHLQRHGVKVGDVVQPSPQTRFFFVSDPNGLKVQFVEYVSGVIESKVTIGKTASVKTTVNESNTANYVGSGSLDVFATPTMIALMERAACEALADALDEGQTSVGTFISAKHTAASLPGAHITATATVSSVSGRKIEFKVSARDERNEIGSGTHTRVIVNGDKFIKRLIEET